MRLLQFHTAEPHFLGQSAWRPENRTGLTDQSLRTQREEGLSLCPHRHELLDDEALLLAEKVQLQARHSLSDSLEIHAKTIMTECSLLTDCNSPAMTQYQEKFATSLNQHTVHETSELVNIKTGIRTLQI